VPARVRCANAPAVSCARRHMYLPATRAAVSMAAANVTLEPTAARNLAFRWKNAQLVLCRSCSAWEPQHMLLRRRVLHVRPNRTRIGGYVVASRFAACAVAFAPSVLPRGACLIVMPAVGALSRYRRAAQHVPRAQVDSIGRHAAGMSATEGGGGNTRRCHRRETCGGRHPAPKRAR